MEILKQVQELEGKCLGDRYKIINNVTRSVSNSNYNNDQKLEILNSFVPKDNLEKKLWVKLLSKFQIKDLFLQKMKSEDHELVDLMFKNGKWFFVANKLSSSEILLHVFPNITTSLRIQFLHCLAKYYDENELDQIFVALRDEYNLKWAFYILHACSSDFIMNILTEENMNVSEKFLLKLYMTRPEFVKNYFIYLRKDDTLCCNINKYKGLLNKLAWDDPQLFFELYHESDIIKPNIFGANTTKKLISTNKAFVLEKPQHYLPILHHRQTFASFTYSEYRKFYMGVCPKDKDEFVRAFNREQDIYSLLKFLKQKKVNFLFDVYKTTYKLELLDNNDLMTDALMKILPIELKAKCAASVIDNLETYNNNWERWYCFYNPSIAIPKFKEFIYASNDSGARLKFVQYMIRSCGNYKDFEALKEVFKYIIERHRNEDFGFRNTILKEVCDNFDLKQFEIDVWNHINNFVALINLGDEWKHISCILKILQERIRYNIINDICLDEYFDYLMKLFKSSYHFRYNILKDNIEYEKKCIDHIGNALPNMKSFNIDEDVYHMISTVQDFNKRHPDEKLTVLKYPWIVEFVKKLIEENKKVNIDHIRSCLEHDDEALEYFKDGIPEKIEIDIHNLKKYIKKHDVILVNFKDLMDECIQVYYIRKFLMFIKNRKFIYIPTLRSKIIDDCLDKFKNHETPKVRSSALRVLAYLLDYRTFYELTNLYFPTEKKVDIKNQDEYTYAIQQAIGCSLARYPGPPETFNALKIFCRGDYLKLTLGSLISVCFKTNQSKALKFLNDNLDQPVSTKKHMIRLINAISKKRLSLKLFRDLWGSEKNPSIRNVIITNALNLFKSDPDAEVWKLLKTIFLQLDIKDKDIFSMLLNFSEVKKIYLKDHIELCWSTAIDLESKHKISLSGEKCSILDRVVDNINIFEEDFLNGLIKQSLNTSYSSSLQNSFIILLITYILKAELDLDKKMNLVENVLRKYIDENWLTTDPSNRLYYKHRTNIFEFLDSLCQSAVKNKGVSSTLKSLDACTRVILNIFQPTQIYEEYLDLRLTHLYLKSSSKKDFIDVLKKEFIDEQVKLYGTEIIRFLTNSVSSFMCFMDVDENIKYRMELARQLVGNNSETYHQIAAIELLDTSLETKGIYDDIMNVLKNSNKTVQIVLNAHINSTN